MEPRPRIPLHQTQTIDNFIVQIGESAKGSINPNTAQAVNKIIGSLDLENKNYSFGISGQAEFSTTGRKIIDETVMAVVDPEAYRLAGLGSLDIAHHAPISASHIDFLRSQGVTVPEGVKGAIYLSPGVLNDDTFRAQRVALHELGHAASKSSGIYEQMDVARNAHRNLVPVAKQNPAPAIRHLQSTFVETMRNHGLEEGRAEMFAFQNIQDHAVKTGTPQADIVRGIQGGGEIAYNHPDRFAFYASRYQDDLLAVVAGLGHQMGQIEGPISGKIGLTGSALLSEMKLQGQMVASGSLLGSLANVGGETGEVLKEDVAKRLINLEQELIGQHGDDYGGKLFGTVKTAFEEAKGRTITATLGQGSVAASSAVSPTSSRPILPAIAAIDATIVGDSVEGYMGSNNRAGARIGKIAQDITTNVQSIPVAAGLETASTGASARVASRTIPVTVEEGAQQVVRRGAGQTSSLMQAAARASKSVAARDSVGMRLAGAAATIFRKRIF